MTELCDDCQGTGENTSGPIGEGQCRRCKGSGVIAPCQEDDWRLDDEDYEA